MGAYGLLPVVLGGLDCDGDLDVDDCAAFSLALIDVDAYGAAHPGCELDRGDFNDDGAVDGSDIPLYVDSLLGG